MRQNDPTPAALTAAAVFLVAFVFGLAGAGIRRDDRPFPVRKYVIALAVLLALAALALAVYSRAR